MQTSSSINFAAQIQKQSVIVYDMRVMLNDEARFFIVQIHPHMHEMFLRKVKEDKGITLEDYGTILYRGWDEPDDALKALLRQKYGLYA